jgi:hypothetical protein
MNNCEEFAVLLDAWFDGECTPEEAARVEEHLKTCGDCRARLAELTQMRDAFSLLNEQDVAVPEGLAEGVMAAVRAGAAPRKHRFTVWRRVLVPLAACLLIALAVRGLPWNGGNTAKSNRASASGSASATEAAGNAQDSSAGSERSSNTEPSNGAETSGDTKTSAGAKPSGDTKTSGDTEASGDTKTSGDAETSGDTEASGDTEPSGDTKTSGDTEPSNEETFMVQSAPRAAVSAASSTSAPSASASSQDAAESGNLCMTAQPAPGPDREFQDQPLEFLSADDAEYEVLRGVLADGGTSADFQVLIRAESGTYRACCGQWLSQGGDCTAYLWEDGEIALLPDLDAAQPTTMRFSGDTLIYEIAVSDEAYRYTVDLSDGTVTLEAL